MVLHLNIRNATATFIAYKYQPGMTVSRGDSGQEGSDGEEEGAGMNGTWSVGEGGDVYDGEGAMYFAVAVILLYGVSIALLVGTTLHRHDYEYEVKGFLRSYARIDQQKRTREKQKVRRALMERNMLSMLPGCTLTATPSILGVAGPPLAGGQSAVTSPPQTPSCPTFSARSSEMTSLAEVDEEDEEAGRVSEGTVRQDIGAQSGASDEGQKVPDASDQQTEVVLDSKL